MPYYPPADLPPPAIIETVPVSASAASDPEQSGHSEHSFDSRSHLIAQADIETSSAAPAFSEPTSSSPPIDARAVDTLDSSATQAVYLQGPPPATYYSEIVPLAVTRQVVSTATPQFSEAQPTLTAPWVAQFEELPEADQPDRDQPSFPETRPEPRDRPIEPEDTIPSGERDSETDADATDDAVDDEQPEPAADEIENVGDEDDSETVVDEDEDDGDDDEDDEEEQVFPREVTPEPFWSNGAVLVSGVLLTPSQPTTRPPTPLDLTADVQEFEPETQILTATGDVVLVVGNGILQSDRLWANLANRFVLVEGNVTFTRGEQVIEADRGEYNLLQGEGRLFDTRGVLFLPQTGADFGDIAPNQSTANSSVLEEDPISRVRGTGNITFGTGVNPNQETGLTTPTVGGFVRRIRFEAAQLDFDSEGWYATDIRFTNDPFSPPELEFRGDSATLTRVTEFQDELYVQNARVIFDDSFTVPLLRDRLLLSRGGPESPNPFFVTIAYDDDDRDGLFVERSFNVASTGQWEFFLTPQFLVQRFASDDSDAFLSNFGLEADIIGVLGPTTFVDINASLSGLDFDNLDDRLRSSVRVQQLLGDHTLNLEYSYRDRLFNGSLGFQDIQSSLGAVLVSPNYQIGDTGIFVSYQASAQYINANTDRRDLVDDLTPPLRVSLGRFQGSVAVNRSFLLWRGDRLPATRDEGLRFTSVPRQPNLRFNVGGRGTYTYYTSNDTQENISATVGLRGEFGHFSRDFLDSTIFNLSYTRAFVGEDSTSPFLFDRNVDQNILRGGIIQQIYGPFRLGFQTSINLDTGDNINTDYLIEYSRRTYGIFLRFNPTQSVGFLGFRVNEFDWSGRAARFGGADIDQVEGGVVNPRSIPQR